MVGIILSAIIISIVFYIGLGFFYKRDVFSIGDIIPVIRGRAAKVKGNKEFSSSTVATSISLATVILAFFDLIPSVGLLLFWAVITTSLGFLFFSLLSKRIWAKLSKYNHRPSLHEFIGTEFNSKQVGIVASLCTALGYLCMFATELTVGAQFLSGLIPFIPLWLIVTIIATVSFIYTGLGGFRVVVVTDRIQMWCIWVILATLLIFFGVRIYSMGGIEFLTSSVPKNIQSITWSIGLVPFILGLFTMNLFTYVTNMALWQRIAGSENPETVIVGMRKSVLQSAVSWGLFVVIAIGAFTVARPVQGTNFLITTMSNIYSYPSGKIVLFLVTLGLYGAMLSTASTQLIAVSHTIYEDIIAPFRTMSLDDRIKSHKELKISRLIVLLSAVGAIAVVEILKLGGFSIADLAFSIYGAALSLAPAILVGLFFERQKLKSLSVWVTLSVVLGFTSAWGVAIYGNYISMPKNGNLVFLSPVVGLFISAIVLFIGILFNKARSHASA
jgi:Na+/proline symporter